VNDVTFIKNSVTPLFYLPISFNIIINQIIEMKKAGIFIMVAGLGLTIFTAFTIFTREKVVDLGELQISMNKPHHLNWSPLVGISVMVVGGILYWQSSIKR
jgi:hypothetical protein